MDLRGDPYAVSQYNDLVATMHGTRPKAPPVGFPNTRPVGEKQAPAITATAPSEGPEEVRITGILVDEVTEPRMDGTRGSALYQIPFQLTRAPTADWANVFVENWNHPSHSTSMHRPGIARVQGDRVILDGTTIDEVEKCHRDTLVLAIETTNKMIAELKARRNRDEDLRRIQSEEHRKSLEQASKRIRFTDH